MTGPAVVWRDGVHIAGTHLWCDALRARDVCFVSSADAIRPSRHGQVVGTAATLALLVRSRERAQPASELPVPTNRPFTLGLVRLELFATGHAVGAAGLWVTAEGRRIVYAGEVCPRAPDGAAGTCDHRAADTLVVGTRYGTGEFQFPDPAAVRAELVDHCREVIRNGVAVVLVRTPLKGLEVAAHLVSVGLPVWSARPIHHLGRKLSQAGIELSAGHRAHLGSGQEGRVLVWSLSQGARPQLPSQASIAYVSGEAALPGRAREVGAGRGFAWSDSADYNDLIAYIDNSGASEVYLIGRHNEGLAASLDRPNRRVRPLGPPTQLSLL